MKQLNICFHELQSKVMLQNDKLGAIPDHTNLGLAVSNQAPNTTLDFIQLKTQANKGNGADMLQTSYVDRFTVQNN